VNVDNLRRLAVCGRREALRGETEVPADLRLDEALRREQADASE